MTPRRILGLQLKRLGDIILTTPAMQMLCDKFPEATVDLMVDAKLAGFSKYVDGCQVVPAPRSVGEYMNLVRGEYDTVLDFTGQDRCLMLAALTGAPRKVTFRKYFKKLGRNMFFHEAIKSSLRDNHVAEHLADLARAIGAEGSAGRPALRIHSEDWDSARAKLHSSGMPVHASTFILIHPGTARPEKFWSPEAWGKVIDFLASRSTMPVVLSASPDAVEGAHLSAVARAANAQVISMAGNLSLGEFLAVIDHAALLACVDSAPVHMADALNTPVFALYGPTDPRIWGPRITPHRWVTSPTVAPESTSMSLISDATVIAALAEFLDTLG